MKQIFTIFNFTFINAAKKKTFIISTIIMILLIIIVTTLPTLIGFFSNKNPAENQAKQICYYIDDSNLLSNAIPALNKDFEGIKFVKGNISQMKNYSSEIKNNGNQAIVVVTEESNHPFIKVITKDFQSGISANEISETLNNVYIAETLAAQGISADAIATAQSTLPFSYETLNERNISGYFIGVIITMLVFFAVYFYSYSVAMSVASDKTSRVMEILVVAAKPSHILAGKCLGMGMLGLVQFFVIIITGLAFYKLFIPGEFILFGMQINTSMFTIQNSILLIIYFILGYTLYAMMNAVCGALVNKVEDLNSAMMPVTLIAMVSFYAGFFSATSNASGIFQKIALYAPFSSPFYVPSKLLSGDLSATQISISLGILIITIAVITVLCIRIYSTTILSYGKSLKLRDVASFIK